MSKSPYETALGLREIARLHERITGPTGALQAALGPSSAIGMASEQFALLGSRLKTTGVLAEIEQMNEAIRRLTGPLGTFGAAAQAIAEMGRQLAGMVHPYQGTFGQLAEWQSHISTRMTIADVHWAVDGLGGSALGFAHLVRIGDAIRIDHPFAGPVIELLQDELGNVPEDEDEPDKRDEASIASGLNPTLIAFPRETYSGIVVAAGFELRLPALQVPKAIEAADPDAQFDPDHNALLSYLEQQLRQFVESELRRLEGSNWIKRRVSEQVRKRWQERQAEEREAGRPVYDLIQYADFMDMADIIGRKDNWLGLFHVFFLDKDDCVLSLRRLHPVRKAMAHSRPIGRADILTLFSETARILRALNIAVFG